MTNYIQINETTFNQILKIIAIKGNKIYAIKLAYDYITECINLKEAKAYIECLIEDRTLMVE